MSRKQQQSKMRADQAQTVHLSVNPSTNQKEFRYQHITEPRRTIDKPHRSRHCTQFHCYEEGRAGASFTFSFIPMNWLLKNACDIHPMADRNMVTWCFARIYGEWLSFCIDRSLTASSFIFTIVVLDISITAVSWNNGRQVNVFVSECLVVLAADGWCCCGSSFRILFADISNVSWIRVSTRIWIYSDGWLLFL